jgi:hypothetical protein
MVEGQVPRRWSPERFHRRGAMSTGTSPQAHPPLTSSSRTRLEQGAHRAANDATPRRPGQRVGPVYLWLPPKARQRAPTLLPVAQGCFARAHRGAGDAPPPRHCHVGFGKLYRQVGEQSRPGSTPPSPLRCTATWRCGPGRREGGGNGRLEVSRHTPNSSRGGAPSRTSRRRAPPSSAGHTRGRSSWPCRGARP